MSCCFCGLMALVALGQHCGGYSRGYSYSYQAPSYNYANYSYSVPYVAAKLQVVATEDYGYGGLLGSDARYELKLKAQNEFNEKLLSKLDALIAAKQQPAPEIQQFEAPAPSRQPQYGPSPQQAPAYVPQYTPAPAPQSPPLVPPQKAPLQPLQAPAKGYNPAPAAPPVPSVDPTAGASGSLGGSQDGQQVLTSILANRCASCHEASSPSGGLALFDDNGNPMPLSIQQLRKVDRAVSAGRMPKNGPLPPGEAQALEEAIVSLYQTARR